jgi:hypothetical protein
MDHPSEGSPDTLRTRVRDGDADAFGELFDSFASHVYSHAFRLTGDWAAAEDVTSLTFLEAWRTRERISRGRISPRAGRRGRGCPAWRQTWFADSTGLVGGTGKPSPG